MVNLYNLIAVNKTPKFRSVSVLFFTYLFQSALCDIAYKRVSFAIPNG